MKPKSLNNLIIKLNSLPGIGKKQAEKLAYYIIKDDVWLSEELEDALKTSREKLIKCDQCGNISEESLCEICISKDRVKKLVVVESPLEVFKFEEASDMKPYYHVLNGLVNIQKNINPEDLNIQNLKERAKKYKEVIIALSPNLEGIVTANYIKALLGDKIKITQLAQGIPLGAAMEYVDELTLKTALDNRKEVE